MEKIIVLCNVPHVIEPGICAFCERDQAKAELEDALKALRIQAEVFMEGL